jgi:hypothetical protein
MSHLTLALSSASIPTAAHLIAPDLLKNLGDRRALGICRMQVIFMLLIAVLSTNLPRFNPIRLKSKKTGAP